MNIEHRYPATPLVRSTMRNDRFGGFAIRMQVLV
jgi:hypothetical protein